MYRKVDFRPFWDFDGDLAKLKLIPDKPPSGKGEDALRIRLAPIHFLISRRTRHSELERPSFFVCDLNARDRLACKGRKAVRNCRRHIAPQAGTQKHGAILRSKQYERKH